MDGDRALVPPSTAPQDTLEGAESETGVLGLSPGTPMWDAVPQALLDCRLIKPEFNLCGSGISMLSKKSPRDSTVQPGLHISVLNEIN